MGKNIVGKNIVDQQMRRMKSFENRLHGLLCFCTQFFYQRSSRAEIGRRQHVTEKLSLLFVVVSLGIVTLVGIVSPLAWADSVATAPGFTDVVCEGSYEGHLQGICVDDQSIYWSFTTTLVKTDLQGQLVKKIPVVTHHGDLCIEDGKLYVAVNRGKFNDPQGNADSWIYIYDAASLTEIARHEIQQVFHGAGGIGIHDEQFFVVGGLPATIEENYVYEYDHNLRFVKKHLVQSGQTHLGIQTATFAHDRWWFGCYGTPKILLVTDADFQHDGTVRV